MSAGTTVEPSSTGQAWTRAATVTSVVIVAVVAAVVSYAHVFDLASRAGEGWRAYLVPLSVDGMLLASTLAIVDRRRAGQPAGWVPWLGLVLGIGASLAANIAAAQPTVEARLVAAWPPLALAISIEVAVIVLRGRRVPAPEPVGERPAAASTAPPQPVPADLPARPEQRPARAGGRVVAASTAPAVAASATLPIPTARPTSPARVSEAGGHEAGPGGERADEAGDDESALLADLIGWADGEGAVPSRDRVKARHGIGSARADRLRDEAAAHLAARRTDRAGAPGGRAGEPPTAWPPPQLPDPGRARAEVSAPG